MDEVTSEHICVASATNPVFSPETDWAQTQSKLIRPLFQNKSGGGPLLPLNFQMLLVTLRKKFPNPLTGTQCSPTACPTSALSSCPGDHHCWATSFRKCSPFGLD